MKEEKIKNIIEEILKRIPAQFSAVEILDGEVEGCKKFVVRTDDSNILIGKNGENLAAFSHIVKKIAAKEFGEEMENNFYVDIEDYHTKKIQKIKNTSLTMASRAKTFRRNIEMEPMNAYERMVVHATLSSDVSVKTESEGEGKFRRVIIKFVG